MIESFFWICVILACHWMDAFQRGRGRARARARRVQERVCGRGRGVVQGEHRHRLPVAPAIKYRGLPSRCHTRLARKGVDQNFFGVLIDFDS